MKKKSLSKRKFSVPVSGNKLFEQERSQLKSELNEIFDKVTEKEIDDFQEAGKDYHSLVGLVKDCSPEKKEDLAIEFQSHIEEVRKLYRNFETTGLHEEPIPIFDNMDLEISHLSESISDLGKNYLHLAEFLEIVLFCNDSISGDLEAYENTGEVRDFVESVLVVLRRIERKILFLKS